MANQVTLTFAGDSASLERSFSKVGESATKMGGDLDSAGSKAKSLDGAMGAVGSTVDSSESKFMGTADVLDGLATTMGLTIDAQIGFARGMGDLAGGLTNLGPLLSGVATKLGLTSAATWAWNTAQTALNLVMSLNPIMLVVLAVAALTAAFVVAWKNSETFRDIVRAAMSGVKEGVGWVVDRFGDLWDFIKELPGKVGGVFGGLADIIKGPWIAAFDAIKNLWNSTIGGFSISVPDWVPVVGGRGFDFPRMHMGGTVPGNPGQIVPILAMAGETMGRAGASSGGGGLVVNVYGSVISERDLGRVVADAVRQNRLLGVT
jgi:phage-related protein